MIRHIVIHCSDSPDDRDSVDAAEIHRWHTDPDRPGGPFHGIGYHHVIKRDGSVEAGRPHYWAGAHVAGYNDHSIGICLVGRNDFSDEQMASLKNLLYVLKFHNQAADICGHYELDSGKTCPNFNVKSWVEEAMPGIDHTVRH